MDYKEDLHDIELMKKLIKNLMKSKGISSKTMIENGLNHSFLYNMKSFYPRCDTLYIISRILGVSMEYLLTGKEIENLSSTDSLSLEEEQLLRSYRDLHHDSKVALNNLIKTMKKDNEITTK